MRPGLVWAAALGWGCGSVDPGDRVDCEVDPAAVGCTDSDGAPPAGVGQDDTGGAAGTEEPEIELSSPEVTPSPLFNTDDARCVAQAWAPDGAPLAVTYAWSNQTTLVGFGAFPEVALSPSVATPGDVVRCTVTASEGPRSTSGQVEVVVGNRAPVVGEVVVTPSTGVLATSTLTCAATASDPDGTSPTLSFAWSNETTGSSLGGGSSVTLSASEVSVGDVVRCTATASDGVLTGEDVAAVEVEAPPPQAGDALDHAHLGRLRFIPAGTFDMGCVDGRDDVPSDWPPGCFDDEKPWRTVRLSTALWMMEEEVTQGRWSALWSTNPSSKTGTPQLPVDRVNWWEALETANAVSRRDGLPECYRLTGCDANAVGANRRCEEAEITSTSGHPKDCEGWRLPTEAEWEYAARAGTDLPFSGGADPEQVAWFDETSDGDDGPEIQPVCTAPIPRNGWGLCDMSGNVREWTSDAYTDSYAGAATVDPSWPALEALPFPSRVTRGGGAPTVSWAVRIANRMSNSPGSAQPAYGFRLVRSAP